MTTAGFLVYVAGTRGLEPQRWTDLPASVGTDYWSEKSGRVLLVVPLSSEEFAQPLDVLVKAYPAPGEIAVKAVAAHRIALECDP